jgi:hypothetical protein
LWRSGDHVLALDAVEAGPSTHHCERSEAIHSFVLLLDGLLRRKGSSQ